MKFPMNQMKVIQIDVTMIMTIYHVTFITSPQVNLRNDDVKRAETL